VVIPVSNSVDLECIISIDVLLVTEWMVLFYSVVTNKITSAVTFIRFSIFRQRAISERGL